jgi:protein-S-isoprenylcysteine O-methyltransferase Ste14
MAASDLRTPLSAYAQSAAFLVGAAVILFASAGTLAIPEFWIYWGLLVGVFAASLTMLDPELLQERMRPGGKRLPIGVTLAGIVFSMHWIVAGLDRGRLHWTDIVPAWLEALGFILIVAVHALTLWLMRLNRFFSSIVRIQSDRGQYVVTGGPYAYIRHPGYAAGIVLILASGIALGSWLAAGFVIATNLPFILYRTINEERVLLAHLPGYADYARRVRWRLIPGIW